MSSCERFVAGHLHLFGTVFEGEVAQRFDGGNVGHVVEAPLIGGRLRDDDVREFLREHRGQAGFVGEHVEKAAAQHDGVADGEHFESSRGQHTAVDFRLNVEIVGDFDVVDDGFENLVDISRRREQAYALQAVENVDLRLVLPFALGFDRRTILRLRYLILNGVGRLNRQLAEFFLAADVLEVVAPEARLRFESHVAAEEIFQIRFLAEDVSG